MGLLCVYMLRDDIQKSQDVSHNRTYLAFPENESEVLNLNKLLSEIPRVLVQGCLTLRLLARRHQLPFH